MASATFELRAVDKTAQAFAAVQNSMQKLHATTKNIGTTLKSFFGLQAFVSIGRQINAMLEDVEANSKKFGQTTDELNRLTRVTGAVDAGMNFLKKSAVFVADKLLDVKDAVFGVTNAESASIADKIRAERDAPKIKELSDSLKDLEDQLIAIGRTPTENFTALSEKISAIANRENDPALSEELNDLQKLVDITKEEIAQKNIAFKVMEEYNDSVDSANEAWDKYTLSQKTAAEKQQVISGRIMETMDAILLLQEALDPFIGDDALSFAAMDSEDIANMEKLTKLQKEYVRLLGEREKVETDLQIIARKAGEIMASSFEDAIFTGQKLGQILRSLAQDLIRMVFNQMVTQKLALGITGFLSGIGMKASGGPVNGGTPYVVGEAGPELFVPNSSGSIIPNHRMGSGGGGGSSVNVTYNIASGVSRSELVPILETERKRLKAEIPDMVRRGGAYRAAFA